MVTSVSVPYPSGSYTGPWEVRSTGRVWRWFGTPRRRAVHRGSRQSFVGVVFTVDERPKSVGPSVDCGPDDEESPYP